MTRNSNAALIQSPDKAYAAPRDILNDSRLSAAEKMAALRNWEDEQAALLRADDENMTVQAPPAPKQQATPPEKMIGSIQAAERALDPNAKK